MAPRDSNLKEDQVNYAAISSEPLPYKMTYSDVRHSGGRKPKLVDVLSNGKVNQ
jgi:hypothetical protein